MNNGIGERLKTLRKSTSRNVFAERFKTHKSTIIRYESGERVPKIDFCMAVCEAYGVTLQWLAYGGGDGSSRPEEGSPSHSKSIEVCVRLSGCELDREVIERFAKELFEGRPQ